MSVRRRWFFHYSLVLEIFGSLSTQFNEHVPILLRLGVENVGEMASAAVLAIVHGSHEDTSSALLVLSASLVLHVNSGSLPQV